MKYIIAIILFLFCIATTAMTDQNYQKPNDSILKQKLTPIQYHVTQETGTEPPFENAYWNNEEPVSNFI